MSTTDSDTKETSQETPKKEEEYKIELLPEDYPQYFFRNNLTET